MSGMPMNKYAPGALLLIRFDQFGAPGKLERVESALYVDALREAKEKCPDGGSVALLRVMHNSRNEVKGWEPTNVVDR